MPLRIREKNKPVLKVTTLQMWHSVRLRYRNRMNGQMCGSSGVLATHCSSASMLHSNRSLTMAAAHHLVGHFKKTHKAKIGRKQKQELQHFPQHDRYRMSPHVGISWMPWWRKRWSSTGTCFPTQTFPSRARGGSWISLIHGGMRQRTFENVLKPMMTPTELLPEVENTPLSATIPGLANLKRQHLLIGDNDSSLTERKKKKG